ncbi:hypothetical protein SLEP1_g39764 [Rubroshorea leprosula]|uniref:Uncharacterized protein n=1 Tax=Rubroshorea leprosula TaxID=152421 RepID=A0AAV5L2H0_9ROSI|nr:hypothetical protein SLEP1_g39764 [Rubroshorea leprosula]
MLAPPMLTQFIVIALYIAALLLISSEVATAIMDDASSGFNLGRRALLAQYNTAGRGGYN